jgi:hypothetical protein
MGNKKIELEYVMNCSPKVLYNRLSTASGLSEWFADDVAVSGKKYTFIWDGASQDAELALKKENLIVRFNWTDDDAYFEFRITRDELTGDVSLIITDYVDEDDIEESKSLWDSQISTLKHILGS